MKYIIQRKDTLSKIAAKHGILVSDILKMNPGIKDPNKITVGQVIVISVQPAKRPTLSGGPRPTPGRMNARVCGFTTAPFYNHIYINPFFHWHFFAFGGAVSHGPNASDSKAKKQNNTPWMDTAKAEIGVAEYKGMKNANPRIMEYFKAAKYWGKDDSGAKNAWCASFVAWVMKKHNFTPVHNAFRAREWRKFGKKIDKPVYGAIGIKSRKGGSHVAFVVGKNEKGDKYYMLGGNQIDKVQILKYPKDVWDTFVVPQSYNVTKATLPVYKKAAAKAGKES